MVPKRSSIQASSSFTLFPPFHKLPDPFYTIYFPFLPHFLPEFHQKGHSPFCEPKRNATDWIITGGDRRKERNMHRINKDATHARTVRSIHLQSKKRAESDQQ